jgi:hypothetical protein
VFDDPRAFPPLPVDYEGIIMRFLRMLKHSSDDTFHLLTIKTEVEYATGREATDDDWYGVKPVLDKLLQCGTLEYLGSDRFRLRESE